MFSAAFATLYELNWLAIMNATGEDASTELMKIIFLDFDFLTRGKKARVTRTTATVLKLISSAKESRSLGNVSFSHNCFQVKIIRTDPRIWSKVEELAQHY